MPTRRELAAIVFTDIVGSTELAQDDEAGAVQLSLEHARLARAALRLRRGRLVKSMGDGLLVRFSNVLDAVEFGVDLQRRIRARNERSPPPPLRVRVGIHLGDVEVRGTDILGDAVNIASRVERTAEPGGLSVSEPVYQQVLRKVPYTWRGQGSKRLQGVREPLGLYRVVLPWEWVSPTPGPSPEGRIAVLPFANLSPDPQDAYFADGLTEEVIGTIARRSNAHVIARTSTMRYKGSVLPIGEIARELGVDRVVEGSVRRSGDRIRVAVKLVDARTEEHVWAGQFDQEVDDIFTIQSEIARDVAGSLGKGTRPQPAAAAPEPAAYTLYLRAVQLFHNDTPDSLREAIALFDRALERDPHLALARVGAVKAWTNLALQRAEEWSVFEDHALPAAREALRIDPSLPEAHAAMAEVWGSLDHHLDAVREAEEAIRLNPGCSGAYFPLGLSLAALGRLEESREALAQGYALDPLVPVTACSLADVDQLLGRTDEMHRVITRLLELHGGNVNVVRTVAVILDAAGEKVAAGKLIAQARRHNPGDPTLLSGQAILEATAGHRKEAGRLLARLKLRYNIDGYAATAVQAWAALGDVEAAFRELDVLADRHSWPWLVKSAPVYAALRRDPRFRAFCKKVGIPVGTRSGRGS